MRTRKGYWALGVVCLLTVFFGISAQTHLHAIERKEPKRAMLDRHEEEISELRKAVRTLENEMKSLRRYVARLAGNQKRTTSAVKKSASSKTSNGNKSGNVGAF